MFPSSIPFDHFDLLPSFNCSCSYTGQNDLLPDEQTLGIILHHFIALRFTMSVVAKGHQLFFYCLSPINIQFSISIT